MTRTAAPQPTAGERAPIAVAIVHAADELARAAGADARLEAEVLLTHALGVSRSRLLARLADPLGGDQLRHDVE